MQNKQNRLRGQNYKTKSIFYSKCPKLKCYGLRLRELEIKQKF